jgi:uridylate kinase
MNNVKMAEVKVNERFGRVASKERLEWTVEALVKNGIRAEVVGGGDEARERVWELLPAGAEVMNMNSRTLDTIGVAQELLESGRYRAVRNEFKRLDERKEELVRQRLGAAPEWAIGSVHAVTEDGQVMIASNTGSQLSAYVYGALHVIWVVGGQKIVRNMDEGFKRLNEYSWPLENARAMQAYGQGSNVSKVLIVNKEVRPDRIRLIVVQEKLGF